MNCKEAAECVSALFDGEPMPHEAAGHLSDCEECRLRLNEYVQMSAELRNMASATAPQTVPEARWRLAEPAARTNWLRKWRGTMRIPRLAFALMLVAIFGLSGGLALVKARSQASGSVLLLRAKIPGKGVISICTGKVSPEQDMCSFGQVGLPGTLTGSLRFISREGDRVQIGIRAKYEPPEKEAATTFDAELKGVPLEPYWMEPDKPLNVSVAGFGTMEIFGEFRDHEPALFPDATLDPGPDELRIWSPLMIRDSRILADMAGAFVGTSPQESDSGVVFYVPNEGRFVFALMPFEGAIEADIQINRIYFGQSGHSYVVVVSGPVARAEYKHVWVLHQPEWRPTSPSLSVDHSFVGRVKLSDLLSK